MREALWNFLEAKRPLKNFNVFAISFQNSKLASNLYITLINPRSAGTLSLP